MKKLLVALCCAVPLFCSAKVAYSDPVPADVVGCNFYIDAQPKVAVALKTVTAGKICEYNVDAIYNQGKKIAYSLIYSTPRHGLVDSEVSDFLPLTDPVFPKPTPLGISQHPRT